MEERKQIFVIGLDDFNLRQLQSLRLADRYVFHALLSKEDIKGAHDDYPFEQCLERAERELAAAEVAPDAIVAHWDFPATLLQSILAERHGLPGAPLDAMLRCEHKYWSRLEQSKVVRAVPAFQAFDPFDEAAFDTLKLRYPFWVKPVKGTDSVLGFKISERADFERAIPQIREQIPPIGHAFDKILSRIDLPEEIAHVKGHWCIAEEMLSGEQFTVSGYAYEGDVQAYGVIDSLNYEGSSSFLAYEYPSNLPEDVQQRMRDTSIRTVEQLGLHNSAYNIEYFYDRERDEVAILEVNPRISQSHSEIYKKVDGDSNEEIMVQIGLGVRPEFPFREGNYRHAAKFYYRCFHDGQVERVPTAEDFEHIQQDFPDAVIAIEPEEGQALHELSEQDSYSYTLATIYLGGQTRDELHQKFRAISERLPFSLKKT